MLPKPLLRGWLLASQPWRPVLKEESKRRKNKIKEQAKKINESAGKELEMEWELYQRNAKNYKEAYKETYQKAYQEEQGEFQQITLC